MSPQHEAPAEGDPWSSITDIANEIWQGSRVKRVRFPPRQAQVATFDPETQKISTDESTFINPSLREILVEVEGIFRSGYQMDVDEVKVPGIAERWQTARSHFQGILSLDTDLQSQLARTSKTEFIPYNIRMTVKGFRQGKEIGQQTDKIFCAATYRLSDSSSVRHDSAAFCSPASFEDT